MLAELENMALAVGIDVIRGGTIQMPLLRKHKQKELPYAITRCFKNHYPEPFVIGDMVWLQDQPRQQKPVNNKVEVLEFHYEDDPAYLKFEVSSADISPFWPIEYCKLAELEPFFE